MDEFFDNFNSYPLSQKILIFAVVAVSLFGIFWVAVYWRLDGQLSSLEDEYNRLQGDRNTYREKLEDQVNREKLQNLRQNIQVTRVKLPSTTQLPNLLKKIQNKAKTAGLQIVNFQQKPEQTKKYYVEIPVAMEMNGTYGELTKFLKFVRNMNRIVTVEDLTLELKDRATGRLAVTASAKTYRYRENAENGEQDSEN
jgi:type IV pilus assembly protein PilO